MEKIRSENSGLKNCQVIVYSIIISKNMHFTSNFKQWEHYSERELYFSRYL